MSAKRGSFSKRGKQPRPQMIVQRGRGITSKSIIDVYLYDFFGTRSHRPKGGFFNSKVQTHIFYFNVVHFSFL